MKVGLLFGTFNPIHVGHLVIAEYFSEFTDLDEVWIIVSPHNPFKSEKDLLDDKLRLQMAKLAIGKSKKIKVSDIEFTLSRPSYTYHTLLCLQEKYRKHNFVLLMGEDNLQHFDKWKDFKKILDEFRIYTYPRPHSTKSKFHGHKKVKVFSEAPLMDISSTFIRNAIAKRKNVMHMLPKEAWAFIQKKKLYKK
jgi:nicotinate-nucleotide adenylyltransferase